jgi:hypothetical protein
MAFAREGHLAPLDCPDCGNEYSLWIPDDDLDLENPVLKCWTCNSEVTLSDHTLEQIREALDAAKNAIQRDSNVGDSTPPKDG